MNKSVRYSVHFSSLPEGEKEELGKMVLGLRGAVDVDLRFHTRFIVCPRVDNPKYRHAKYLGIPVLRPSWVRDSAINADWLPVERYELEVFEGIKIGVIGFRKEDHEEIKELLEKHLATVVSDVDEIFASSNSLKVIVMNPESVSKYQSQMISSKLSVVSTEWMRQCILENRYLNPEVFSIKQGEERRPQQPSSNLRLKEADAFMNKLESSDRFWNYLVSSVIYFHGLESEELELQKRLVHLGGGVFLDMLIPNITHVVTDSYTEEDARNFNKFSNVLIVNTIWLRDCFFFRSKVPETEFLLKPNKKVTAVAGRSSGAGAYGTNGRSASQNQGAFSEIRNPGFEGAALSTQRKVLGEQSKCQTMVFAETIFYFDPSIKLSLSSTLKIVLKNSGLNLKSLEYSKNSEFRDKKICCVIPDGRNDLLQSIQSQMGSKKAFFVSPRWVERCLDRSTVIFNIAEEGMVDLFPFPHPTPYPNLAKYSFCVSKRLPISRKSTVKGIIDAFGATLLESGEETADFEIVEKDQAELDADPQRTPRQRPMLWLVRLISSGELSAEDHEMLSARGQVTPVLTN